MKSGKKLRRNAGMVALLVIAGVFAWRFLPRERRLLSRATYVLAIHSPSYPPPGAGPSIPTVLAGQPAYLLIYDPYFWKSDREVITFRTAPGPPPRYEAYSYHLDTGRQEALTAFNRRLASEMERAPLSLGPDAARSLAMLAQQTLALSPDGFWVLYSPCDPRTGRTQYVALTVNGSKRLAWADKSGGHISSIRLSPCWLPDNRHWTFLQNTKQNSMEYSFLMYDLASVQMVHRQKVSVSPDRLSNPLLTQTLGVTRSGDIVLNEPSSAARGLGQKVTAYDLISFPLTLSTRNRGDAAAPGRRYTVRMPQNGYFLEGPPYLEHLPVLSPQGDRLAWRIVRDYSPPCPAWIRHLEAYIGMRPHATVGLWVSRLDGSHMQEIGHMDYKPGEEMPQEIRWTPDGKRLSFAYKDALYTVPSEDSR